MLGYMTEKQALEHGFTHHGSYYGIPVWIADATEDGLMVAAKWAPMEYIMTMAHYVEGFMREIMFPNDDPVFQFRIGLPIRREP